MEKTVHDLLGVSIDKIKEMVDVNTVVGDPIELPGGVTIIPVSKVSYGFASGGSDLPTAKPKDLFGGGSGAGINITPVAFLIVNGTAVNLLPVVAKPETADRIISMVPEMVDKVSGFFSKDKKPAESVADSEQE